MCKQAVASRSAFAWALLMLALGETIDAKHSGCVIGRLWLLLLVGCLPGWRVDIGRRTGSNLCSFAASAAFSCFSFSRSSNCRCFASTRLIHTSCLASFNSCDNKL